MKHQDGPILSSGSEDDSAPISVDCTTDLNSTSALAYESAIVKLAAGISGSPPLCPLIPPLPFPSYSPEPFNLRHTCEAPTFSETIRIGARYFVTHGFRLDYRRPVLYMSHSSLSLDLLYSYGRRQSCWWRCLDCARERYPEWFLPRNFVIKVYELPEDDDDMRPDLRAALEVEAYRKLASFQGRGVPRCYGAFLFQYRAALLLQYIDGITLSGWLASNKRAATELDQTDIRAIASNIMGLNQALTSCGVKGDIKADNFILEGGTVWILDFDISEEDAPF